MSAPEQARTTAPEAEPQQPTFADKLPAIAEQLRAAEVANDDDAYDEIVDRTLEQEGLDTPEQLLGQLEHYVDGSAFGPAMTIEPRPDYPEATWIRSGQIGDPIVAQEVNALNALMFRRQQLGAKPAQPQPAVQPQPSAPPQPRSTVESPPPKPQPAQAVERPRPVPAQPEAPKTPEQPEPVPPVTISTMTERIADYQKLVGLPKTPENDKKIDDFKAKLDAETQVDSSHTEDDIRRANFLRAEVGLRPIEGVEAKSLDDELAEFTAKYEEVGQKYARTRESSNERRYAYRDLQAVVDAFDERSKELAQKADADTLAILNAARKTASLLPLDSNGEEIPVNATTPEAPVVPAAPAAPAPPVAPAAPTTPAPPAAPPAAPAAPGAPTPPAAPVGPTAPYIVRPDAGVNEAREAQAAARAESIQALNGFQREREIRELDGEYRAEVVDQVRAVLEDLERNGQLDQAPCAIARILATEKVERIRAEREAYLAGQDTETNKGLARKFIDKYTKSRKVRIATTVALGAATVITGGGAGVIPIIAVKAGLRGITGYSAARAMQKDHNTLGNFDERIQAAEAELAADEDRIRTHLEAAQARFTPAQRLEFRRAAANFVSGELRTHLEAERTTYRTDRKTLNRKRFIAGLAGVAAAATPFVGGAIVDAVGDKVGDAGQWVSDHMPGDRPGGPHRDPQPFIGGDGPSSPDGGVPIDAEPSGASDIVNPLDQGAGASHGLHVDHFTASSGDSIWSGKEHAVNHFFDQLKSDKSLKVPGLTDTEMHQWEGMSEERRKQLRLIITDRLKDNVLAARGGNSLIEVGDSINTTPESFGRAFKFALKQMTAGRGA